MTAEVVMSILLRRERGWLRSRETRIHIESAQRTVKVPKMSDSMKSAMSCSCSDVRQHGMVHGGEV